MTWSPSEQKEAQRRITEQIIRERQQQDAVWGHLSPQSDIELLTVLAEEFGEVARELLPIGATRRLGERASTAEIGSHAMLWMEAIQHWQRQSAADAGPRCQGMVQHRPLSRCRLKAEAHREYQ